MIGPSLSVPGTAQTAALPWTPADLIAGVVLWLDAADPRTLTAVGGGVSQWDDKGTLGNHAQQTNSANRPTTGMRAINGLNALDFNGSTTWMNLPDNTIPYDATLVVTAFQPDDTNPRRIISNHGLPGTRGYVYNQRVDFGDNSRSISPAQSGVPMILSAWVDGIGNVAQGIMRNGDSAQMNSGPVARTGIVGNQNIGSHADGTSAFLNGAIGELIIVTGDASVETRQMLEGYVAHKWGMVDELPAAHPFATNAPRR